MIIKVVIYCRVSTEGQEQGRISPSGKGLRKSIERRSNNELLGEYSPS